MASKGSNRISLAAHPVEGQLCPKRDSPLVGGPPLTCWVGGSPSPPLTPIPSHPTNILLPWPQCCSHHRARPSQNAFKSQNPPKYLSEDKSWSDGVEMTYGHTALKFQVLASWTPGRQRGSFLGGALHFVKSRSQVLSEP